MTDTHPGEPSLWEIEVFYDGACPLCSREIGFLRRCDTAQRIRFTDIAARDFRASDYGKTQEALMAEIHGRLPNGDWVVGVEVFRRLYAAIGLGPLVWLTKLPVLSAILDKAYAVFARNRIRWTRQCSDDGGTCGVESS
jgi:predicted DCC family thiol-disulfide oxidoreductase YuxK